MQIIQTSTEDVGLLRRIKRVTNDNMKNQSFYLLTSVVLGFVIVYLFNRKSVKPYISNQSSQPGIEDFELHLKRRRERILKQPVLDPEESEDFIPTDSFFGEGTDDGNLAYSEDDLIETSLPTNKNMDLYYDTEIHTNCNEETDSVPEYENISYSGYSSYRPSFMSDISFFKQEKNVNTHKLGDWNWRFVHGEYVPLLFFY